MKLSITKPLIAIGCAAGVLVFAGNIYERFGHLEAPSTAPTSGASVPISYQIPPAPSARVQYTVLLDVSASRPAAMIDDGERFVDTIINHMSYGDRLLLLQMYEEGVNESKRELDLSLVKPSESLVLDETEELTTARNLLKEPVHLYFRRTQIKAVMHTDILTTLSIASEQITENKRNRLVVLSDMLQSSKEFEFERLARMPPPDWITTRRQQGLVRPLYGACVIAVGADPSTRQGVVIREFWQKYFEASNASLRPRNYRTTPPSDDFSWCESRE